MEIGELLKYSIESKAKYKSVVALDLYESLESYIFVFICVCLFVAFLFHQMYRSFINA